MTQQQFNNNIVEIANKIFHIREYSFTRRGLKFDYRRPDLMLSSEEKERIKVLEKKALKTLAIFTEQTAIDEYDEFIKNRGTKRT